MKLAKHRNRILATAAAIALGAAGIGSTYATWSKNVEAEDAVTVTTGDATLELLETKWYWTTQNTLLTFRSGNYVPIPNGVAYHEITDPATFRPVPGMYIIRTHKVRANLQGSNLWARVQIKSDESPTAPLRFINYQNGIERLMAGVGFGTHLAGPMLKRTGSTGKDILSIANQFPSSESNLGFAEIYYFPWESGNESINLQSTIGPATITLRQCRKATYDCAAS